MTIERRVKISACVLVLSILGTAVTLFLTSRLVADGIKQSQNMSQIVRSVFMCRILMDEFLVTGNKRPLQQWNKQLEDIGRILNTEGMLGSADPKLLEDLKNIYRKTASLAEQTIALRTTEESDEQRKNLETKITVSSGLLYRRLEELAKTADDLNADLLAATLKKRTVVQTIIVTSGLLLGVIILVNIFQIRKSVVRPLKALSAGADRIGAGNFDYVAETKSDDEVGNLARAFNTMIERLNKRDLALRQAKDELELRVKDRTAKLKMANERLGEEIEERKRAGEALSEASAYNRSLIEASLDPLVTISPEGKITDVNTGTERVTGFSRNELIGTDFADYFTEPSTARTGYQQVFRDGAVKNYELAIRHKGGRVTPVMYNASTYRDDSGKIVGIFAAARDITDRKRAEEELTRSNEDLQQFAYVASHDLQEPLRNVASCLQLLEQKYQDKLDAKADQLIHYAVDSAVRMKALIQSLLTYSRIATKGKSLGPVDSDHLMGQTVKNLRSSISEAGAVVTTDALPTVLADDTQLLQVFQNLIQNAIKFRKDEPPKIHVSAVKNKNEWIFSVKDNGIGIELRHLDRIFVIFQRLNKRTEYEGTGIGLAIVKKVVERHHGRVWVESEAGVGTTFYFTLPDKGNFT